MNYINQRSQNVGAVFLCTEDGDWLYELIRTAVDMMARVRRVMERACR